jgi:hypothetical protein
MLNAKKKCRCIKSGQIQFSPEAALWIHRTQVYRSLLCYHGGLIQNRGNLKQTFRCCGIPNCLALLVEEVLLCLKVSLKQCDHFWKHGKQYRRKHLHDCLMNAQESKDEQREKEILAIINQEKDRSFWRWINYVTGKARGGAVHRVLVHIVDQEGTLTKNITQESVQEAIYTNIHRNQFFLAEAAPICTGNLRGKFGYNAITRTAKAILNGTYDYPTDFDQATREICEECARIWEMIPIDSLDTIITKEQWRRQWKGRCESTLSSELGLHFGHYITSLLSDHSSYFHALKATLIIWRDVVLERWARGLSVMLEKIFGCGLITKL